MPELAQNPRVLLVGSIPLGTPETVMETAAAAVGDRLEQIPDGETGDRTRGWLRWLLPVFRNHPALEPSEKTDPNRSHYASDESNYLRPKPGVKAKDIAFGALGYADYAKSSYQTYVRLKSEGKIAAATRFQVAIPTPLAFVGRFIEPECQLDVLPGFEKAIVREVEEICAAIPHDELAIQWDVCIEVMMLEGVIPASFPQPREFIVAHLGEMGNIVPPAVALGYHLCYGRHGGKHFVEPKDLELVTRLFNDTATRVARTVEWVHLPVPIDRDDDAYFRPLDRLALGPSTRLYLGLVHEQDGAEGALRRIASARRHVADFGISTECGMGSRKPEIVPDLLRLHAEIGRASAPA